MAGLSHLLELHTTSNRGKTLRALPEGDENGIALPAGTTVVTEAPLLNLKCRGEDQQPSVKQIIARVRALPATEREIFDNLSRSPDMVTPQAFLAVLHPVEQLNPEEEKILRIWNSNAKHSHEEGRWLLYPTISRVNHSCSPNCILSYDPCTNTGSLRVIFDIVAHEELSIAYLSVLDGRATRQTNLRRYFGFRCTCESCELSAQASRTSDLARRKIAEWHESYKTWANSGSGGAELAARLSDIISEPNGHLVVEKVWGERGVLYELALHFFATHSNSNHTALCAQRIAEAYVIERGRFSRIVQDMENIGRDPTLAPGWGRGLRREMFMLDGVLGVPTPEGDDDSKQTKSKKKKKNKKKKRGNEPKDEEVDESDAPSISSTSNSLPIREDSDKPESSAALLSVDTSAGLDLDSPSDVSSPTPFPSFQILSSNSHPQLESPVEPAVDRPASSPTAENEPLTPVLPITDPPGLTPVTAEPAGPSSDLFILDSTPPLLSPIVATPSLTEILPPGRAEETPAFAALLPLEESPSLTDTLENDTILLKVDLNSYPAESTLDVATPKPLAEESTPVVEPSSEPATVTTHPVCTSGEDSSELSSAELEAKQLPPQPTGRTELAPPLTTSSAVATVDVDSTRPASINRSLEDLEPPDLDVYPSPGALGYFSSHVVSAPEYQPFPAKHGILVRTPLTDISESHERSSEPGTSVTSPLLPPGLFPPGTRGAPAAAPSPFPTSTVSTTPREPPKILVSAPQTPVDSDTVDVSDTAPQVAKWRRKGAPAAPPAAPPARTPLGHINTLQETSSHPNTPRTASPLDCPSSPAPQPKPASRIEISVLPPKLAQSKMLAQKAQKSWLKSQPLDLVRQEQVRSPSPPSSPRDPSPASSPRPGSPAISDTLEDIKNRIEWLTDGPTKAVVMENLERLSTYPDALPLSSPWTLSYSVSSTAGTKSKPSAASYLTERTVVFTAATVPYLCSSLKALLVTLDRYISNPESAHARRGLLGTLKHGTSITFFRDGIQPVWEDPWNHKGGRIMIFPPPGSFDATFEQLVLLLAGSSLEETIEEDPEAVDGGVVVGIVASCRKAGAERVEVWSSGKTPGVLPTSAYVKRMKDGLANALGMPQISEEKWAKHWGPKHG